MLLLALLVLAHFLCSICHTSVAAAETSAAAVHEVSQSNAPTGSPATAAIPHGTGGAESAPLCHGDGDSSADQRVTPGQALVLLGLGAAVLAVFRVAPRRPGSWLVQPTPARTLSGARLLVSLCVQRV